MTEAPVEPIPMAVVRQARLTAKPMQTLPKLPSTRPTRPLRRVV